MTVRLTLICHGRTAVSEAAFPADDPLDAAGQAALLKLPRNRIRLGRAVVSPMLAARQTAEALGLEATAEPALRDIDYGRWKGRTLDDIAQQEPENLARWSKDPAFAGHGGESLDTLFGRCGTWLQDCAAAKGRLTAVSHAAVLRAVAVLVMGAPVTAFWRVEALPATRTELTHDGRRWSLRGLGIPLMDDQRAED